MNSEMHIEERFIQKPTELKYVYREDIRDRDALLGIYLIFVSNKKQLLRNKK